MTRAARRARQEGLSPLLDEESLYLIEPYALESPGLLLEAVRGIFSNQRSEGAPFLGPQRYLVKELRAEHGFRPLLERRLAARFGLQDGQRSVVAVTSGTAALRLALRALLAGRPRETEVLVPAITVANTAEAVLMEGFVPVLVDVDPETWTLDPESAVKALSPRAAALISVDWLGTGADYDRLWHLCQNHGLLWISDSAQSFGIRDQGRCPTFRADATIFSTGYPKVFHTGGRGGLLVVAAQQADALAADPSGALRNELLAEINSLFGLLLLPRFDELLERRREIGAIYTRMLEAEEGFHWQRVTHPERSNRYQMSARVDPVHAGATPAEIAAALLQRGIQASTERMRSLEDDARLRAGVTLRVPLPVSRELSASSLTLPMPQGLTPDECRLICEAVLALRARTRVPRLDPQGLAGRLDSERVADLLAGAAPERYWNIAELPLDYILPGGVPGRAHRVLAPPAAMLRESVWAGELLDALRGSPLHPGKPLIPPLVVRCILPEGDILIDEEGLSESEIVQLTESGSSARVSLCLGPQGELEVLKRCDHDGIDGNGKPWLDLQYRYLEAMELSTLGDLFVRPTAMRREGTEMAVALPYVPSCSLARCILGGADEALALSLVEEVCDQLARRAWTEGVIENRESYLDRVHLQRMVRRLKIAAERHAGLREVLTRPHVEINGQPLMGFHEVSRKILGSRVLSRLDPPRLALIHGDLNLYNILCLLGEGQERRCKLIDPRGTPLWAADAASQVERGDFVYDLAKIKFSLAGFVALRADLMDLQQHGEGSFSLQPRADHLGVQTLIRCDERFIEFCAERPFLAYVRERLGERGDEWKQRLHLAEAANFIADAACALGRDCPHEVLPLFLLGLHKLNAFYAHFCATDEARFRFGGRSEPRVSVTPATPESPSAGLAMIRQGLAEMEEHPRWDLIEVLVRREAVPLARRILERAAGFCLPYRSAVYASHLPYPKLSPDGPWIVVHGVDGTAGSLTALGEGILRTRGFLRGLGLEEDEVGSLRVLTVVARRDPGRDLLFSRAGEWLLAAGPQDLAPLLLQIEAAYQLALPGPGRWVVGLGDLFLVSRPPVVSGEGLAVLPGALGLADLAGRAAAEPGWEPAACFLPHTLAAATADLAQAGDGSLSIAGHLLSLYVFDRKDWLERARRNGGGARAHALWESGARLRELSPGVEGVSAGARPLFHSLATAAEHLAFFQSADPCWRAFLDLPRMACFGREMAHGARADIRAAAAALRERPHG